MGGSLEHCNVMFTKPKLFFGNSLGRYENDSLLHVFQSKQNAALFTEYQKKNITEN